MFHSRAVLFTFDMHTNHPGNIAIINSVSVVPGWALESVSVSKKLPGEADAAGPWITPGVGRTALGLRKFLN